MHPNTKNLSGKTFGRLTAIKIVEKHEHTPTKRRGTFWLCKCECGNEKIVMSTELTRGDTKSCGCGNKFENSKLYKGVGKLAQSKFSHIEWGAKKRGFEFLITKEYAWDLYEKQNGKCFYTQLPINLNTRNNSMTASIDRIDSNKGYIEDNVVWVHKDINIMKNKFSKEYFLMLCKKIVENHGL
jgi:ribosomal protein S27E